MKRKKYRHAVAHGMKRAENIALALAESRTAAKGRTHCQHCGGLLFNSPRLDLQCLLCGREAGHVCGYCLGLVPKKIVSVFFISLLGIIG